MDTRVVFHKSGQYGLLGLNENKNFNEGIKEETLLWAGYNGFHGKGG